jgi:hypothetical protein
MLAFLSKSSTLKGSSPLSDAMLVVGEQQGVALFYALSLHNNRYGILPTAPSQRHFVRGGVSFRSSPFRRWKNISPTENQSKAPKTSKIVPSVRIKRSTMKASTPNPIPSPTKSRGKMSTTSVAFNALKPCTPLMIQTWSTILYTNRAATRLVRRITKDPVAGMDAIPKVV